MTPTKGEPLTERLQHAFGERRIRAVFADMMGCSDLIDLLTDEARDELVSRLISDHKLCRKYAAASRKHYREQQR